jgi:GDP-L-fucose synthase
MKSILITGSSGLVGSYLTKKCLNKNWKVIAVDKMEPKEEINHENYIFENLDLLVEDNIISLFKNYKFDAVFNCFGIKGSPLKAKNQPVDFLYPSVKINTEIINQCYLNDIWLIFVSSVGVYGPSENFIEDDIWKLFPSQAYWYPSWSKRFGELLLTAYKQQYNYDKWSIIRPANIFGEYDDFSGNGTVISSMIKKIYESDGKLVAWGDGTPIRDFVYGKDVADAIIDLFEKKLNVTINFGSGEEITINSMIHNLIDISKKDIEIEWDTTKPNGDMRRQMNIKKQKEFDLLPHTSFYKALENTYKYYIEKQKNNI